MGILKNRKQKTVFLILMILLVLLSSTSAVSAQPEIRIEIDGEPLNLDVAPLVESGRVLVPVAHLMRALGAEVIWNPADRTVSIQQGERSILLTIDSRTARINGEAVQMEVPARIVESRTIVPLRFVAENLEADVQWDGVNRMVSVSTQEPGFIPQPVRFERVEINTLSGGLENWVSQNLQSAGIHTRLEGDWFYVMAAGGERPTGGYEMRILTVTEVQPGEVFIEAELIIPGPEEMVTMALTYPSEVIRFNASGITRIDGNIRELRRGMQEVTLYFMRETETAFLIEGESRLFQSSDVTAENVLAVLLAGPESASLKRVIPRDVKLLDASVSNGLATVNFSRELLNLNIGAEVEGVLVHSIVWTLTQLESVNQVQILVGGEIVESLAGHVSIDQPIASQPE